MSFDFRHRSLVTSRFALFSLVRLQCVLAFSVCYLLLTPLNYHKISYLFDLTHWRFIELYDQMRIQKNEKVILPTVCTDTNYDKTNTMYKGKMFNLINPGINVALF